MARSRAAAGRPSREEPARPRLSVCIPTYRRPDLLARALGSVIENETPHPERIEVVVADNDAATGGPVARPLLERWPGPTAYVGSENIGMIGNFNRCIAASHGEAILILHDDDRLLPGALEAILATLDEAAVSHPVHLFGTRVVSGDGRLLRRHTWDRRIRLTARVAVRRLLTNSSMVRFPSVVVERWAYERVGGFRDHVGGADDLDMWIRLFSLYGVILETPEVSAYTIHPDADTETMFDAETIGHLLVLFDDASERGLIDPRSLEQARTDYFHQFILGGTYRRLLAGDRAGAQSIMALFGLPALADLGVSRRWAPVRVVFGLLLLVPAPVWSATATLAIRLETRTRSWL